MKRDPIRPNRDDFIYVIISYAIVLALIAIGMVIYVLVKVVSW